MRLRWGSRSGIVGKLCVSALALLPAVRAAVELNIDDDKSIKQASQTLAYEMMYEYYGNDSSRNGIPGLFGAPYYWWESGAAFNALIDYWYYTGDEGYVPMTLEAMIHQIGDEPTYMPQNQSRSLGNDDQGFWGIAAMTAAEKKFPNPPDDKPSWLTLAMGVFNSQTLRWEEKYCGGGLRWQIFSLNNGFDYKNTISNGVFFQLGARLARYTKNDTYAEWADRAYNWTKAIGLEKEDEDGFKLFDGADINPNPANGNLGNCTRINHLQWSYNAGMYLAGAAYMYNYTESDYWKQRVDGILKGANIFFRNGENGPKDVMVELACEPYSKCNVDQRSFKAYLSRFMAMTVKMAPHTAPIIMPKLRASAQAAVKTCTGGERGNACGLRWETGTFDVTGLGENMCALEVVQSNLIESAPPYADMDNGISEGDPNAGLGGDRILSLDLSETTMGDRVGAGFLTTFVLLTFCGGAWWMVI